MSRAASPLLTRQWLQAQMTQIIETGPKGFLAIGRMPDTEAHLSHLRQEFTGQPVLNFTLATCIVRIRRRESLDANLSLFFALIEHDEAGPFLARHLSLRWLVSICDTLADHAEPALASAALTLVVLVNLVKLAETERAFVRDPEHDPAKIQSLIERHPVPLFGGMILCHPRRGDMPRNLFERIGRRVENHGFLERTYRRMLDELGAHPNLLSRLAALNPEFPL